VSVALSARVIQSQRVNLASPLLLVLAVLATWSTGCSRTLPDSEPEIDREALCAGNCESLINCLGLEPSELEQRYGFASMDECQAPCVEAESWQGECRQEKVAATECSNSLSCAEFKAHHENLADSLCEDEYRELGACPGSE